MKNRTAVHLSLVRLSDAGGPRRAETALAAALEAFDGSVPEALALAEALDRLGRREEGLAAAAAGWPASPGQEGNAELQRALAVAARKLGRRGAGARDLRPARCVGRGCFSSLSVRDVVRYAARAKTIPCAADLRLRGERRAVSPDRTGGRLQAAR